MGKWNLGNRQLGIKSKLHDKLKSLKCLEGKTQTIY